MALNSETLLSYSQFLQCGACSCDITSPKLLSCLHSFCQTCLKDQDGCHVVTCPTCHQPTEKAEVKDNKLLSDLQSKLDILRQLARGSDLSCSCCNASAGSMCFECEKFLCQKCFDVHQVFTAKDSHSVESLESLKEMSFQEFLATARKNRLPYCPDHDKQTISIFCRTCSKSICTTCTVLMHKPPDHEYRDIKQEAQEQKDNIAEMCTKLCKKEDAFEEILKKLLNLKGDHEPRKKELEEQIKVSVNEAVRKVEQKGEAHLKELEGIHKGMDAKMSKKLLHMEDVQKRIEGSKDLLENMIKYATDEEVMEMQKFVKSSLQQLQRSKPGNADALDFTVEFKKTDPEPLNLLGSLVVHKDMATGTNLEASTPIKIKRERQDDEEIKPGTYLAFELPPKHPYTPSLEKPGVSPVHPNFGQETADDSLLDYNDDECEETQSVVSGMMENKENIGDSLNSKESDKGTPLLECAGCLPSPAPAADQNIPVEDHSIVFFDLETTGLGSKCDIIQLSAACMEKTFNVYMVPRTPIMKEASAVTGFTVRRHKLYLHCRPVQTKTHRDCLMSFLAFLRALDRPLLAGHNIKRFDCPILARVLEEFQLNEEFKLLVSGFLDTLILSKDLLQNTGIKSFKQENLVKELLKKSYPAHNALEDVKALQDLYSALRPTPAQITSHLFTLDHMESHMSLQPLVEGKAISKTTAQKLARLGFNFEKMKRSHLQNPSEGLRQFLEPLKEELKNSMFTKTVDKICDFFEIEQ